MADQDKGKKPLKNKKNQSVDTEPVLNTVANNPFDPKLQESSQSGTGIPMSQVDYFIRLGLGDRTKLNFYRKAIMDPHGSIRNPQYREFVGDIAYQLLTMIWADQQMLNRLRSLLQMNKGMTEAAVRSLQHKAIDAGVEFHTLLEVYLRGYEVNEDTNEAFNRVNSFLANGRAAAVDSDLKSITFSQLQSVMKKKV